MIQPADVHFEDGVPIATDFGDVYFSRAGGLAETHAIFLAQNRLVERWRDFGSTSARPLFTIGELGFGTGLNFCATVQAFRANAPANARLRYFSCESRPLPRDALVQALRPFSESAPIAEEIAALLEIYPPALPGVHVLPCPTDKRVQLVLLYGDATEMFAGLSRTDASRAPDLHDARDRGGVNAWFFDGFAPARNPDMWSLALFQETARLSAFDATFATYTAAGFVRRNLEAAGFRVEKIPGFGSKREMLRGQRSIDQPGQGPSHAPDSRPARRAIVIGAGLAGTATSRALIQRGFRVTLIEREDRIAAGASGNALGVAAPAVTAEPTPLSRLSRAGFLFLRATLAAFKAGSKSAAPQVTGDGVLLLAHTAAFEKRFAAFAASAPADFAQLLDADAASAVCGTRVERPGLFFPDGLCLSPPVISAAFLHDAPELRVLLETEAIQLERTGDGWRVLNAQGMSVADAPVVVIANGPDANRFDETRWLPLRRVRGQTFALPERAQSPKLKTAVCYDGYVTPAGPNLPAPDAQSSRELFFQIGATFEEWNANPATQPEHNRRLYDRLIALLPAFAYATCEHTEELPARAAFRTASKDRFPVIGPVPNRDAYLNNPNAAHLPGLYVHSALGSRGLVFAALGAEILAASIAGEIVPIESELLRQLSAERFLLRELRLQGAPTGSRAAAPDAK